MSKTVQSVIETAIAKADASYFFENYTKQAAAVLKALDSAGFAVLPKDLPEATWEQAAREMRTGRVKPEEHVRDVYQTIMRIAAAKG
jgi:hypothetical protein